MAITGCPVPAQVGGLAGRGKSPPDVFPRMKTSGFHGRYASAIASLRSSRLFVHSLLLLMDEVPGAKLP